MQKLDRYKKLDELGTGAQGTTFLAFDKELEREVAIKSLHNNLIGDVIHVKRFKEEAKTLANLKHPNIIPIYDVIADEKGCCLVMEYFKGYPLDKFIANRGQLSEQNIVDIFILILDAMIYIHKKNIIHRDIKPSNIMISDGFDVRLLDFGIAKNIENDPTLTIVGNSAGYTPMYMSPEHSNGNTITKFSDIYSLGVTLWQMLTGKAPYKGMSQGQIFVRVASEQLPSVQSINSCVSDKMNEIVQKATQKDPKDRYSSCKAFKIELEKLKKDFKADPIQDEDKTILIGDNQIPEGEETVIIGEEQLKKVSSPKKKDSDKLKNTKFEFLSNDSIIKLIIKYLNIFKLSLFKLFSYLKVNLKGVKVSISLKVKKYAIPYILSIWLNIIKLLRKLKANFFVATSSLLFKFKKYGSKNIISFLILSLFIVGTSVCFYYYFNNKSKVIPTVNFELNSFRFYEPKKDSNVRVNIFLSKESPSIITVPFKITGDAERNKDYKVINENKDKITIRPFKKSTFIDITILNDNFKEDDEKIKIELENPVNAKLGEKINFIYTINNDDLGSSRRKSTRNNRDDNGEKLERNNVVSVKEKNIQINEKAVNKVDEENISEEKKISTGEKILKWIGIKTNNEKKACKEKGGIYRKGKCLVPEN